MHGEVSSSGIVLLFALCILSAMSFTLSPAFWLYHEYKGRKNEQPFSRYIWLCQMRVLTFTAFIICIYNNVLILSGHPVSSPITEFMFFVILFGITVFLEHLSISSTKCALKHGFRDILYWGCICLAGCAASGIIVIGLFFILTPVLAKKTAFTATFLLLCLLALPALYAYLVYKKYAPEKIKKELRLYRFLWPVLLAYAVLSAPVTMQEFTQTGHKTSIKTILRYKI